MLTSTWEKLQHFSEAEVITYKMKTFIHNWLSSQSWMQSAVLQQRLHGLVLPEYKQDKRRKRSNDYLNAKTNLIA